jgi:Pentatricopeptide repeat domain
MYLILLLSCLGLCTTFTSLPQYSIRRCLFSSGDCTLLRFQDASFTAAADTEEDSLLTSISSSSSSSLNETLAPLFKLEDDHDDSLPLFSGIVNGLAQQPLGSLQKEDTAFLVRFFQKAPGWIPRTIEAALELESILKRLIDEKYHGTDIEITAATYAAVVEVWAMVNVPDRAQEIHDAMILHHYTPTIESYNGLLLAWGRNLTRVEQIWQDIVAHPPQQQLQPIDRTFYRILEAYSRANHDLRANAQVYVQRCEELFESMPRYGVQRHITTFTALQRVYCRSDLPNAGDKVVGVLERLRDMYLAGDENARPHVMNCNREYRSSII